MMTGELEAPLALRDVGSSVGFSANGIFVIMDMLLHPALNPQSLVRFHVCFGQSLQIPVTDLGFVVAGVDDNKREFSSVEVNAEDMPVATRLKDQAADRQPRIDLEPYWEGDARNVVFRVRIGGVVKCTFSPTFLIFQLGDFKDSVSALKSTTRIVSCRCGDPSAEISVPETDGWKVMEISQLCDIIGTSSHVADRSCSPGYDRSRQQKEPLFIHAGWDHSALVLCCGMFWSVPKFIALRCLKCAYEQWSERIVKTPSWDVKFASGAVMIDAFLPEGESRSNR
jgi:hypothetical protein